jgi:sulfoxide reductase heme-binding subunit YedZ
MKTMRWLLRAAICVPAAWLTWRTLTYDLGADPAEALNRALGDVAIRLILLNLYVGIAIALLKPFPKWLRWLARERRFLGVAAWAYLVGHVTFFVIKEGTLADAVKEVRHAVYLWAGAGALAVITGLAATSNDRSVRALGYLRWKRLHRLIYPAMVLAAIHQLLIEKRDVRLVGVYFGPLFLLYAVRAVRHARAGALRRRRAGRPG